MTTTENTEQTTDEHTRDAAMGFVFRSVDEVGAAPSTIHQRRGPFVAVAATGFAGALLAVTLSSAQAIPDPDYASSVPGGVVQTDSHRVERGCFITPPSWNEALDGPLPRCYTELR